MTESDRDADISVPGGLSPRLLRRRLVGARWVLATTAALLAVAILVFSAPFGFAMTGFVVVVAVAMLFPHRGARERSIDQAARMRDAWPDASIGMIIEALPDAGIIVDRRGIVRTVNSEAERLFGSIRPGEPLSFRLRVPALLQALERVSSAAPAERICWSEKVPTERWFEANIAPAAMSRGGGETTDDPKYMLIVVRDLTEQRRLERMRADFVANASHELRTPLASLRGFIETLQGPAHDDEAARDRFLDIMNDQAARMSRLIGDLLSLSRIEMRAHVQPETIVDLRDVLGHVVDALAPLAEEYGVTLESRLPDTPLELRGDHDELVQSFENLVQNAIKYGSDGKRALVSAAAVAGPDGEAEAAIVATVRDWGPGIAEEHLPRLTERFYRIDVASSRQKQGTGLGLAIVKHILNRHRAVLTIENAPDSGAVFSVRFESRSIPPGKEGKLENPLITTS